MQENKESKTHGEHVTLWTVLRRVRMRGSERLPCCGEWSAIGFLCGRTANLPPAWEHGRALLLRLVTAELQEIGRFSPLILPRARFSERWFVRPHDIVPFDLSVQINYVLLECMIQHSSEHLAIILVLYGQWTMMIWSRRKMFTNLFKYKNEEDKLKNTHLCLCL